MPKEMTSQLAQVKVTEAWLRFIYLIRRFHPHAEITVKVANGEPVELVGQPKPKIRFDKDDYIPGLTE